MEAPEALTKADPTRHLMERPEFGKADADLLVNTCGLRVPIREKTNVAKVENFDTLRECKTMAVIRDHLATLGAEALWKEVGPFCLSQGRLPQDLIPHPLGCGQALVEVDLVRGQDLGIGARREGGDGVGLAEARQGQVGLEGLGVEGQRFPGEEGAEVRGQGLQARFRLQSKPQDPGRGGLGKAPQGAGLQAEAAMAARHGRKPLEDAAHRGFGLLPQEGQGEVQALGSWPGGLQAQGPGALLEGRQGLGQGFGEGKGEEEAHVKGCTGPF